MSIDAFRSVLMRDWALWNSTTAAAAIFLIQILLEWKLRATTTSLSGVTAEGSTLGTSGNVVNSSKRSPSSKKLYNLKNNFIMPNLHLDLFVESINNFNRTQQVEFPGLSMNLSTIFMECSHELTGYFLKFTGHCGQWALFDIYRIIGVYFWPFRANFSIFLKYFVLFSWNLLSLEKNGTLTGLQVFSPRVWLLVIQGMTNLIYRWQKKKKKKQTNKQTSKQYIYTYIAHIYPYIHTHTSKHAYTYTYTYIYFGTCRNLRNVLINFRNFLGAQWVQGNCSKI